MKKEKISEEQFVYTIENCDFGTNSISCRIKYNCAGLVSVAEIEADGKYIGTAMLTFEKNDSISVFEIDSTSGIHTVRITCDRYLDIRDVTFSSDPVCSAIATKTQNAKKVKIDNVESTTWEATDMLGRKIASTEDVRGYKDRKVGIFYWSWRDEHAHSRPVNVSKIIEQSPAAEYNYDHPAWGERPLQCHWSEPLYGYYLNSDPYIIRRHAILLANAGIDMITFDCTNASFLWRSSYEAIFKGFQEARECGINAPQISFMLNFGPLHETKLMLCALYQSLYKPGRYKDLWFEFNGKPLMLAYSDALPQVGRCESETRLFNEIREFFTFREPQPLYAGGPGRLNQWGWLEIYPQNRYVELPDGSCEMMTVGVSQNANKDKICTYFNDKDTYGRSYTHKNGHSLLTKDSYKYGYNFQEQWDRAIEIDPQLVFVTGWNEWIMGQFKEPWITDKDSTQIAMVDAFDYEHSRDIEMDKDGYLDTYYLQLVHNIRRYKGAYPRQYTSVPIPININGSLKQWKDVTPYYKCNKGSTIHRDWDGFTGTHYTNFTGRNDIVGAKVARDDENIYFYVECADDISEASSEGWMTLFIDKDRSKSSGWEGYDYVINRTVPKSGKTKIERYVATDEAGSFTWETIGYAKIKVKGKVLQLQVPREIIGMNTAANPASKLCFEFKWSDNMQEHNVMDFYQNGDTAPIGRFNYLYKE